MISRRTPLKRSGPPRKKRPGIRRGQPTPEEKTAKREFIYELSGGQCELKFPGCRGGILPWDGDVRERWHLVYMKAKRRFGWPTEGPDRMRGGCYFCHIVCLHTKGLKPDGLS